MSDTAIYKAHLLDHFKHPRNKAAGDLSHLQVVHRGSNPRCGDDIEIGFSVTDGFIAPIEFRGRGCSVCIASASMMTEVISGQSSEVAKTLATAMQQWIEGEEIDIPEGLRPLHALRHHPARKKCVILCWNALATGLREDAVYK